MGSMVGLYFFNRMMMTVASTDNTETKTSMGNWQARIKADTGLI